MRARGDLLDAGGEAALVADYLTHTDSPSPYRYFQAGTLVHGSLREADLLGRRGDGGDGQIRLWCWSFNWINTTCASLVSFAKSLLLSPSTSPRPQSFLHLSLFPYPPWRRPQLGARLDLAKWGRKLLHCLRKAVDGNSHTFGGLINIYELNSLSFSHSSRHSLRQTIRDIADSWTDPRDDTCTDD